MPSKFDKWRNFVPKIPPKCKRCIGTKVWWFKWPKLGHIGQLFAFSKDVLFGVNLERGTLNFEIVTFLYLLYILEVASYEVAMQPYLHHINHERLTSKIYTSFKVGSVQ
jgi:hypothetical protein